MMDVRMQMPELKCMDPENYRKYFRILCWSGTRFVISNFKIISDYLTWMAISLFVKIKHVCCRSSEKKSQKKCNKKDKLKRLKVSNSLAVCYAPALLGNPSHFAVYATVRRSILARCRQLQSKNSELSDESDNDDLPSVTTIVKIPKVNKL